MIGLSKSSVESIIDRNVRGISDTKIQYAVDEVIEAVAKAIEDNNKAIERDIISLIAQRIRDISR